jgi:hypothetical protein
MAVVVKQISDPLPLPRKLNPALPESIELIILKALAKEREGRYQTAGEMAKDLAEALAIKVESPTALPETVKVSQPILPSSQPPSPQKKRRMSTWVWAGGCLLTAALIAGAIGIGIIAIPTIMDSNQNPSFSTTGIIATQSAEASTPGQSKEIPTSVQLTKTTLQLQTTKTPAPPQSTQLPGSALRPEDFHLLFSDGFESYPKGILSDAPDTPWIRAEIGNAANVTNYWVHSGEKNLQIDSFVDNTERDYEEISLDYQPAQLNIELWYTPDGYFSYKDFAQIGLSNVTSKTEAESIAYFWAVDHDVFFKAIGIKEKILAFNGLEYSRGPADMGQGTPKHNYIRAEFDFRNNIVRFYIGADQNAPLRSSINFDGSLKFNAVYIAGGLNPTYIDDLKIEVANIPR